MRHCTVWYPLQSFEKVKNTHEGSVLIFSGGIEVEHWLKMGSWNWNFTISLNRQGPSIKYVRKIFRKSNISNPLIRTRKCAYQGVRNVSFSEHFAYVLNGWPLSELKMEKSNYIVNFLTSASITRQQDYLLSSCFSLPTKLCMRCVISINKGQQEKIHKNKKIVVKANVSSWRCNNAVEQVTQFNQRIIKPFVLVYPII